MSNPGGEATVVTNSPERTEALGRALGGALRPGDVVALDGDLGAGKTVFVRGLAAGAGAAPDAVRSPTFVLHHVYRGGRVVLHHLDFYRLGSGADLGAFDLDTLLDDGAVAVEWAEYAQALANLHPVRVHIDVLDHMRRQLTFGGLPSHLASALAAEPV